ncbi:MAG: ATP-binding protein [Leptolyngbya sp. Prado105]|nr:ATP-binding protein [Leptolyngbya sp. Prado105]
MNKEDALRHIDQLLAPNTLGGRDRLILSGAWNGKEYDQIAAELDCSVAHAKYLGTQLWKLLSETLGRPVTKSTSRRIFEQMLQPIPVLGDQTPVNGQFYGRSTELANLSALVDQNHLVAIIGSPGIGKSALAAKLIQVSSATRWDQAIWKTLNPTTRLDDLIESLLSDLKVQQTSKPRDSMSLLLEALAGQRCLIVLDAAEVLRGSPEYEIFLRQIVSATHRSCVLLTSEIPILFIQHWQFSGLGAKNLLLRNLDDNAAKQILRDFSLQDEGYWQTLIDSHGTNPLVLKLIANSIVDLFNGRVGDVIHISALYTEEINSLISRQFRGMGVSEKRVVLALAQSDVPSFADLQKHPTLSDFSSSELVEALGYLEKRSIIEVLKKKNQPASYKLSSIVRKHALNTLDSESNNSISCAVGA